MIVKPGEIPILMTIISSLKSYNIINYYIINITTN